jgi:hypothetical protein
MRCIWSRLLQAKRRFENSQYDRRLSMSVGRPCPFHSYGGGAINRLTLTALKTIGPADGPSFSFAIRECTHKDDYNHHQVYSDV